MTSAPAKPRVLVVDDDRAVRESLRRSLEFNGYAVSLAEDGAAALAGISGTNPDAIVMDVMMPRLDGIETTRALRSVGNQVPILVLQARDAVGDRVEGLDAGADDYLTKPFALDELLARLRALLRRATPEQTAEADERLEFADLTMDLASREVRRGDRPMTLTRTEFALLELFMRRAGTVLTREQLLDGAWDMAFETRSNIVDVYIRYLREKVDRPFGRDSLETVRGVGYRLRSEG